MRNIRAYCTGLLSLLTLFVTWGVCIESCYAKDPENTATAAYFSSRGERLTARFDMKAKKVTLTLPDGKSLTLPEAVSASGARYSDGKMTFWEHQGTATLFKGELAIFEGKEAPQGSPDRAEKETASPSPCAAVADARICDGVTRYAANLKKTDKDFGNPSPVDPFECQLDACKGKQPINALCRNVVDKIAVKGDYASVAFVVAPAKKKYEKLPIMADGALCFLMKKDKTGTWRGTGWFLGSDAPSLSKKKMKELGISAGVLAGVGWKVEEE
jgi:membrane-bound inhibitor of C-type lysozyme